MRSASRGTRPAVTATPVRTGRQAAAEPQRPPGAAAAAPPRGRGAGPAGSTAPPGSLRRRLAVGLAPTGRRRTVESVGPTQWVIARSETSAPFLQWSLQQLAANRPRRGHPPPDLAPRGHSPSAARRLI